MAQMSRTLLTTNTEHVAEVIEDSELLDHEKAKIYFEHSFVTQTLQKWKS